MKEVTMKWAAENASTINLIDVRSPAEYNVEHTEGAINIPMVGMIENPQEFMNKEEIYYIMCHSGGRSSRTIQELDGKGYDLVNVAGGISALK